MKIVQTGGFARRVKRLHAAEKKALDRAVKKLIATPDYGSLKKGTLAGVRVHKYKVKAQQYLLAYTHDSNQNTITLLAVGTHENFYRDLEKRPVA